MAIFILVGWLLGLALGAIATAVLLIPIGIAVPPPLAPLLGPLTALLAALPGWLGILIAFLVYCIPFLLAYLLATLGVAPLLRGATANPTLTFPVAVPVPVPAGVGVVIAPTRLEFLGRGLMIGASASSNALLLSLVPVAGAILASWSISIISLSAILFVARNRVFQGFLGWSAWLFPVSWIATGPGLLIFLLNIPLVLVGFGLAGFRIDWTTGVIESHGGVSGIAVTGVPGARVSFSLGNFTFLGPGFPQLSFTAPTTDAHETGHTLNTAAAGGIVLWINAIDQNIFPRRENLAYGELLAEGHADTFGTLRPQFALRWWF